MRSSAPALAPILRSPQMAELLAHLLMNPGNEYSVSELARHLDIPLSTLQGEVQRLLTADLIHTRKVGNTRFVAANADHPAARPLTELLSLAYGPPAAVRDAFSDVPGVSKVLIFGSWAARYHGIPGRPPNDIDVLVVGSDLNQMDLFRAADRAQGVLGQPVNPILCTPQQWDNPEGDVLITQIQQVPFVEVLNYE